ncbi:MAG: hypothetical protein OEZ06_20005 [Myxococcales bacterium]|nr:hypothetical protein [Myxococcales bacterium]
MRLSRDLFFYAFVAIITGFAVVGCASDDESLVGSGTVTDAVTDVMFVESVRISLPFKTIVYNGEPREIRISGEDNLIAKIVVEESSEVSKWEISAPHDLNFEQHEDVEIRIPYIDMVTVSVDGDVEFADDPVEVWNESEAASAGSGG